MGVGWLSSLHVSAFLTLFAMACMLSVLVLARCIPQNRRHKGQKLFRGTASRTKWARLECDACTHERTHRDTSSPRTVMATVMHASKKNAKGSGSKKARPPKLTKNGGGVGFGGAKVTIPVDPGWARLREWLETRGAVGMGDLEVGIVNAKIGLRGVVATRAFATGEEIFVIPRDACILSEARADASPIRKVYGDAEVPAPVRVALLLLWLSYAEPDEWGAVLSVLPTLADFEAEGGGPLELWSPDEVEACGCPLLAAQVSARKRELRTLYDTVLVPGWEAALAAGHLQGMPLPAYEALQLAAVVVASRAYGETTVGATSMLVPAVDMCNHEVESKVNTAKGLAPWGAFVVVANRPIAAGDEVFITYGPMPNRMLLAQFGFTLSSAGQQLLERPTVPLGDLISTATNDQADAVEDLCGQGLLARAGDGKCSPWQAGGSGLQEACQRLTGDSSRYEELLKAALASLDREAPVPAEPLGGSPRYATAAAYRKAQRDLLVREMERVGVAPS